MARNMKSMYSKKVTLSDFKMKKYLVFLFLTIISQIIVRAEIPLNYYNSAEGLNGSDLKKKLNEIISGHLVISYQNTDEVLSVIDRDFMDS